MVSRKVGGGKRGQLPVVSRKVGGGGSVTCGKQKGRKGRVSYLW